MEAYETRVAVKEKKKLMVPIPLDEEVKAKVSSLKRQWGASWWQQYTILFCRGIKERRHDYFSWLRITQVLSTAIILGLLWWNSDTNSLKGLQDQVNNGPAKINPWAFSFPFQAQSLLKHFSENLSETIENQLNYKKSVWLIITKAHFLFPEAPLHKQHNFT